jgi:hypothetical protein
MFVPLLVVNLFYLVFVKIVSRVAFNVNCSLMLQIADNPERIWLPREHDKIYGSQRNALLRSNACLS